MLSTFDSLLRNSLIENTTVYKRVYMALEDKTMFKHILESTQTHPRVYSNILESTQTFSSLLKHPRVYSNTTFAKFDNFALVNSYILFISLTKTFINANITI